MNSKFLKSAMLLVGLSLFAMNGNANDTWTDHPDWVGSWSFSEEVTTVFGFEEQDKTRLPKFIQVECLVSKDAAAKVLGTEMLESVQMLVDRMGHQVQAAGNLVNLGNKTERSVFFLTWKKGAQYIWFGDPSEAINMAKVHYIRGVNRDKDALVFDFGGVVGESQRGQKPFEDFKAFGYRRSDQ